MPAQNSEEIVIDTTATVVDDDTLTGKEDRGDVVDPELSAENLEKIAKGAAADGATDPDDTDPAPEDGNAETRSATGARIPKARFDEVNEQRKQAQREAEEARAETERIRAEMEALRRAPASATAASPAPAAPATPAAPAFDVKAQERAYAEALLEADVDKAMEIRERINAHLSAEAEAKATSRVTQELTARQMAEALDRASDQAVKDFPYLNTPEGADALDIILAARDAKIARGMPAHEALAEAVKTIAPKFAPASDTPSGDSTAAPAARDTRSAAAVARGAADSIRQPPQLTAGVGDRTTAGRVNVETMTDADFENLSLTEKRRLRGDI
ncbi:hypothetical protein [Curvibacter lanceolatus]|uniref:hypothetical protein n=1 Tax=Curvibacter lanceolatus TaxID=86182 RepID=UPI0003717F52|nr:hypothetical protein [Curvibacter lanceolatus]